MQGNIQNKVLDSLNKYHVDKMIVGSNQSVQANPSRADKQNQLKDNILGLQVLNVDAIQAAEVLQPVL